MSRTVVSLAAPVALLVGSCGIAKPLFLPGSIQRHPGTPHSSSLRGTSSRLQGHAWDRLRVSGALAAAAAASVSSFSRIARRAASKPSDAKPKPAGSSAKASKAAPKAEPKEEPVKARPPPPSDAEALFGKEIGVTAPLDFFDPLGLCPKDKQIFFEYRACEIKHGRVAMMASVGAVVQHFVTLPIFETTTFGDPMPKGFSAVWNNPASFGFTVLALVSGLLELVLWKEDPSKGAGNYGDPLGLGQYNEDMRNRELNNGRMAMFAAMGIIVAELATGKDAIEQLGI